MYAVLDPDSESVRPAARVNEIPLRLTHAPRWLPGQKTSPFAFTSMRWSPAFVLAARMIFFDGRCEGGSLKMTAPALDATRTSPCR